MNQHYLLHTVGAVDPDLHGPYPTEAIRDDAARRIRLRYGDEHRLYRLDLSVDGVPVIGAYGALELEHAA